jgi:hypothetical protein
MKRKALLIGNTSGLNGIKVDLENYAKFLKSLTGGAWNSAEIELTINPTRFGLLQTIKKIKNDQNDYVVVFFSGHGAQVREVLLEINSDPEYIVESELQNLASRQLNIYDCCRGIIQVTTESFAMDSLTANFSDSIRTSIRDKYNQRILQAIPQQSSLYSCSPGQSSYDTAKGAIYATNLIKCANTLESDYKIVSIAHTEAAALTIAATQEKPISERQTPEAILPKCISLQQLIISINPQKIEYGFRF